MSDTSDPRPQLAAKIQAEIDSLKLEVTFMRQDLQSREDRLNQLLIRQIEIRTGFINGQNVKIKWHFRDEPSYGIVAHRPNDKPISNFNWPDDLKPDGWFFYPCRSSKFDKEWRLGGPDRDYFDAARGDKAEVID